VPAASGAEFVARCAIGGVPGEIVLLAGLAFNAALLLLGLLTVGLQQATGEVLPRYDFPPLPIWPAHPPTGRSLRAWFRPHRQRQQLLALIITDRAPVVANRILREMRRGATALAGTGMYTGQPHTVLMCALTVTKVPILKSLVRNEDPGAFVIVTPVQEVLGKGFQPLQEEP